MAHREFSKATTKILPSIGGLGGPTTETKIEDRLSKLPMVLAVFAISSVFAACVFEDQRLDDRACSGSERQELRLERRDVLQIRMT